MVLFAILKITKFEIMISILKGKGKVIPLQAQCGPEGG
jgi:hypothetical protein